MYEHVDPVTRDIVNALVDRLRAAGLRGDKVGKYYHKGMLCGPAYIYKAVIRIEREAGTQL